MHLQSAESIDRWMDECSIAVLCTLNIEHPPAYSHFFSISHFTATAFFYLIILASLYVHYASTLHHLRTLYSCALYTLYTIKYEISTVQLFLHAHQNKMTQSSGQGFFFSSSSLYSILLKIPCAQIQIHKHTFTFSS